MIKAYFLTKSTISKAIRFYDEGKYSDSLVNFRKAKEIANQNNDQKSIEYCDKAIKYIESKYFRFTKSISSSTKQFFYDLEK